MTQSIDFQNIRNLDQKLLLKNLMAFQNLHSLLYIELNLQIFYDILVNAFCSSGRKNAFRPINNA